MPTENQIAAQLKKDTISRVYSAILHLLEESVLHESKLWPKNGFVPGYFNKGVLDVITVGIRIEDEYDIKNIRLNNYCKSESRAKKQHTIIVNVLQDSFYDGIHITPFYPEHIDKFVAHYHDDFVMDMITFQFTIDK